jgi:hypothetical protein
MRDMGSRLWTLERNHCEKEGEGVERKMLSVLWNSMSREGPTFYPPPSLHTSGTQIPFLLHYIPPY